MWWPCRLFLFLLTIFLLPYEPSADQPPQKNLLAEAETNFSSQLFSPSDEIRVLAPSRFPQPTRFLSEQGKNATVVVQPSFGRHNQSADAVLAYAEGYSVTFYQQFLETLAETGFRGDVVLAIAEKRLVEKDVELYLQEYAANVDHVSRPNLIVYQVTLDCNNGDVDMPDSHERRFTKRKEALDPFQMCRLDHVYGHRQPNGEVVSYPDLRRGRPVATIRYELYWIWSLQYNKRSWLVLLDARDAYFQTDPFANVPRVSEDQKGGGLLWFFGENAEATRLGKSRQNMKWLSGGYGVKVLEALSDKPTICSGSTMGEQIAIETYLRAMVNENDECDFRRTGSDQGFHNYLYYSSKLMAATETIRKIVVWEQGKGAINNLGALRIKPLKDWGIYSTVTNKVYQWDGTLSPVVHQYDRDGDLFKWMISKRHKQWRKEWQDRHPNMNESGAKM